MGQYQVGPVLGVDHLGLYVTIGTAPYSDERVALKFLPKSQIQSAKDAERLSTEITCLNLLNHQNIVKLYQVNTWLEK